MKPLPPWKFPALIAHRGGGTLAPENTLAAMKKGLGCGFGAVEFDVKLSKDNHSFLLHDDTLDRTTNGHGNAKDKTFAALRELDAGSWFSREYAGESLAQFSTVANYLQSVNMVANVEIKPCPGREKITGEVVGAQCVLLRAESNFKPLVTSFSVEALRAARKISLKAAPALAFGVLVEDPNENQLTILQELNCVSLHCNHERITKPLIDFFHHHGYRVLTYTVDEVERAEKLFAIGVDGIFTNNLIEMAVRFPEKLRVRQGGLAHQSLEHRA